MYLTAALLKLWLFILIYVIIWVFFYEYKFLLSVGKPLPPIDSPNRLSQLQHEQPQPHEPMPEQTITVATWTTSTIQTSAPREHQSCNFSNGMKLENGREEASLVTLNNEIKTQI